MLGSTSRGRTCLSLRAPLARQAQPSALVLVEPEWGNTAHLASRLPLWCSRRRLQTNLGRVWRGDPERVQVGHPLRANHQAELDPLVDHVRADLREDQTQEAELLYLLASNAGTVVSRGRIFDAVWGAEFLGTSNIIDRHVRSLRAKLQDDYRSRKGK